jgi:hypothetical protein
MISASEARRVVEEERIARVESLQRIDIANIDEKIKEACSNMLESIVYEINEECFDDVGEVLVENGYNVKLVPDVEVEAKGRRKVHIVW